MAKKLKAYPILRSIHFYSAAICGMFLLLYFITGYLLVKPQWFDHTSPKEEAVSQKLAIPSFQSNWELAQWSKELWGISGKIEWIQEKAEGVKEIEIISPKEFHLITVYDKQDSLVHSFRKHNVHETVKVMHRMHGYGGGFLYDVYLICMDLCSLSLLVFVFSGIFLWIKLFKQKWVSMGVLLVGFAYTLLILYSFYS